MGIEVHVGQKAENVHGADLVIYTAAILPDNPEWVEMQRTFGLPSMERAELLGQLMEGYQQAIGVCGTHGKTTTTSMLSQVLVECGLDPTVHIGGQLDAIGGSTRIGKGSAFLAEACEFKASFHHMHPTMAVVTNIEEDHLDFYKDLDDIQASFRHFLHLLPADGLAIGNGDDPRVRAELDALTCRHQTFGMDTDNDWYPGELHYDSEGHGRFDLMFQGKKGVRRDAEGARRVQCDACAGSAGSGICAGGGHGEGRAVADAFCGRTSAVRIDGHDRGRGDFP